MASIHAAAAGHFLQIRALFCLEESVEHRLRLLLITGHPGGRLGRTALDACCLWTFTSCAATLLVSDEFDSAP